ncbi:MAG TPA: SurA N-terminal domain-containing protein [Gemmatimonadales bacterium]|nr:SurA N-terminal domain-containing protein [Gemmatimonadales bacterium]
MLRTMRSNAKWIFYILAIAFVGWLAVGQVMSILGPSGSVVLRVNGREYQITEYQQRLQLAYEQYRQQNGTAPLTREEEQQIQDQVINQMIQEALLQQEYKRLGIRVTDAEIIDAARTSPPPEVMRDPQFQTDSQFDIRKWQQFLATNTDRQLLAQIEAVYRDQIPRIKLAQYLTSDVYIPDAKLWRIYRDQHDSVRIASLAVWPYTIPDSSAISDAELLAYLAKHSDEFKQPARAYVRFIALPRMPNASDTAAARAHLARVRSELARGAKFEDVAKRESSDTVSGQRGGDLGWIKRNESTFDAQFMQGLRGLKPGQVSAPVTTQFGYHLIRIDQEKGDSLKLRHILIPVALQGEHLDQVEAKADTLERVAAERTDPTVLDSTARRLGLQVSPTYQVIEGDRFTLGRYVIPDVSVWAFEAPVGETSPVIEALPAYYVFQLDSVTAGGVPPLHEVRARVTAAVRLEKQKTLAHGRADSLAAALRGVPDLATAATARGLAVQRFGPFTRLRPPSYLGREPVVVGTAFGLSVAERSRVLEGESGYFIIESLGRQNADSAAWVAQRETQRTQLRQAAQQARIQQFIEGLRAKAKIVDRRREIYKSQGSADATNTDL